MAVSMSAFQSLLKTGKGNSRLASAFSFDSLYLIVLVNLFGQEMVTKKFDVRPEPMLGFKKIALIYLSRGCTALPCPLVKRYDARSNSVIAWGWTDWRLSSLHGAKIFHF